MKATRLAFTSIKITVRSLLAKSYIPLFLFGVFMMIAGDFPRFPLGIKERHLILLIFSWPKLYLVLLCCSFLSYVCFQDFKWQSIRQSPFLKKFKRGGPSLGALRPLYLPITLILVSFFLSILFSEEKAMGFQAYLLLLTILFFLFMFSSLLQDNELFEKLDPAIAIAILFLSLRVILWRLEEGLDSAAYYIKNNSWVGKLQIAWILNIFAPYFLFRFFREGKLKPLLFHGATWIMSGIAIFTLFSRAGSLVFALTTLAAPILNRDQWKKLILLLLFLMLLMTPVIIKSSTMSSFVIHSLLHFPEDGGFIRRTGIWKEAMQMFKDHPLTGIGLGAYDEIAYSHYHTKYDEVGEIKNWFYRNGWHAHSVYLHLLAETGALGFFAWSYLWFMLIAALFREWKRSDTLMRRSDISAILCSLFAFFILSITENPMAIRVHESLRINLAFWFITLYALHKISNAPMHEPYKKTDVFDSV